MTSLNQNWRFHLGDAPDAWQKDFDDRQWDAVCVPHDWAVTQPFSKSCSSGTGYLPGGTGWYRLRFSLPGSYRGKKLWVCFDGVYKNCQVWLNGYNLGKHAYGYTPFRFDISPFASYDETENVLSVKVCHEDAADSRWYTGSGITRKVSLDVQESVFFDEYSVRFLVEEIQSDSADVRVQCTVVNESGAASSLEVRCILTGSDAREALALSSPVELAAGEKTVVMLRGTLHNPRLWSDTDPYLYTLSADLLMNGNACNRREERVGIRDARFDPDKGFFLNGVNMKLNGVCIHHDGGCLGAAVPKRAWRRRLAKLKSAGCNAIRMSHNPHSPELYELCDEMGFLVIDEAFDEWEGPKNKWTTGHNVYPPKHQGYAEDFPACHEADLRAMVRRDRNHPSVILWSIGNEIDYPNDPYAHPMFTAMSGNNDSNKPEQERVYNPARPNMERICVIARRLAQIVREEDDTRPVTAAAAFPELSSHIGFIDALDVVGYNYKEEWYEQDHKRFPLKPFYGSENHQSMEAWKAVRDHDFIAGQFLWTGVDFLGEALGWPVHGSMAGLLTTAGLEKPLYYFRKSLWSAEPAVQLATARPVPAGTPQYLRHMGDALSWNYAGGETVNVMCFTNCPQVDILLNGALQGTYRLADYEQEGFISCEMKYCEGVLEAVGTAADGRIAGCSLMTAHAAAEIVARPDTQVLCADGEDIAQIEVTVTDGRGVPVPTASDMIHVSVEGAGTLLGIENGNQADNTEYSAPHRAAYRGRLLVYVRAGRAPGGITVRLSAFGMLREAVVELEAR